jgi:hypothetical protein
MLSAAGGLVVEKDDVRPVAPGPVEPHVGLGLRGPPRFVQHLDRGLVGVQHVAFDEAPAHGIVHELQPPRSGDHPVGHGLAADVDAEHGQALLLPVERHALHELAGHDGGHGGGRGQAAGEGGNRGRRDADRRSGLVLLAVAAGILHAAVLDQLDRRRDELHFLSHFGADGVHGAAALRAGALLFGHCVLDLLHLEHLQVQRPLPRRPGPGVGDGFEFGLGRFGRGFEFGLVEHQRELGGGCGLAGCPEHAAIGEAELLLEPLKLDPRPQVLVPEGVSAPVGYVGRWLGHVSFHVCKYSIPRIAPDPVRSTPQSAGGWPDATGAAPGRGRRAATGAACG